MRKRGGDGNGNQQKGMCVEQWFPSITGALENLHFSISNNPSIKRGKFPHDFFLLICHGDFTDLDSKYKIN